MAIWGRSYDSYYAFSADDDSDDERMNEGFV